ncbi:MAG: site-specific integrase [Bacteroidales bacterium]
MQATTRIYYQIAPAKRTIDNLCPVKLCVTHRRIRKYYSIAEKLKNSNWQFLSDSDIEKVTGDSPRGKYRDIAFEYKRITDEAEKIINNVPMFSFNQFEELYFNRIANWDNVFSAMIEHIQTLKIESRFGYASSFESTLRAIKEFHEGKTLNYNCRQKVETRYQEYIKGKNLQFVDLTASWLKKFDLWLQNKGKSKSTIGIYMRNLRVLFNLAINKHKVKAEYPFKEYKPKNAAGRKIALTAHQISMIATHKTEHPLQQYYRDLFMFSFFGSGMNLSDIARLRYSSIQEGEISFVREKTKGKDNEVNLNVPITESMQSIIDRYGNKAIGFDSFIFPILKTDWGSEKKYAAIKDLTKQMNKYIRQVARAVGIKENISSYAARHSWATISKNSGSSIEFIKEQLGHSSVSVTERYLKSFEKTARVTHSEKIEKQVMYGE